MVAASFFPAQGKKQEIFSRVEKSQQRNPHG